MSMSNKIREILVYLLMVEDAAGLDYIKDKVAKRTGEIIFHAECEKKGKDISDFQSVFPYSLFLKLCVL